MYQSACQILGFQENEVVFIIIYYHAGELREEIGSGRNGTQAQEHLIVDPSTSQFLFDHEIDSLEMLGYSPCLCVPTSTHTHTVQFIQGGKEKQQLIFLFFTESSLSV